MEAQQVEAPTGRLTVLADRLDYFTEEDLLLLADVTPSTAEVWRKRGQGPTYVLAGNRYLYPRAAVMEWLSRRTRVRAANAKDLL